MKAIKRIISREQFEFYNIPENFGQLAEMILLPINEKEEGIKNSTFDPEEDY